LAEETIKLQLCVRSTLPTLIDVGGNNGGFRRNWALGKKTPYHNLAPVTCAADVARTKNLIEFVKLQGAALDSRNQSYCHHKLCDCDCIDLRHDRVFLFSHSFYYMSSLDLLKFRVDDEIWIVSHIFRGSAGSLPTVNPEFDWYRDGTEIVMTPRAPCGTSYRHPDPTDRLDEAITDGLLLPSGLKLYLREYASDIGGGGATVLYHGYISEDLGFADSPKICVPPAIYQLPEGALEVIQGFTAKIGAQMTTAEIHDLVHRGTATIVARFRVCPDVAEKAIISEVEKTIDRSMALLKKLNENKRLADRVVAEEIRTIDSPQPYHGPQMGHSKRSIWWYILVFSLCAIGILLSLLSFTHTVIGAFARPMFVMLMVSPLFVIFLKSFRGLNWRLFVRCRLPNTTTTTTSWERFVGEPDVVGEMDSNGYLDPNSPLPTLTGFYKLVNTIGNVLCLGYGDPLKLDPKHKVDIEVLPCDGRAQAGSRLMGITTRFSFVLGSCRCNFHNALCNRHGVKQP
jgi:hypothetical protein